MIDEDVLLQTWKSWREGTASKIVDPVLNNGLRNEIMRCIHIGLLCVQESVTDRPTMASVALMLNSFSFSLPIPSQPPLLMNSGTSSQMPSIQNSLRATGSTERENSSVQASVNEVLITELHPR